MKTLIYAIVFASVFFLFFVSCKKDHDPVIAANIPAADDNGYFEYIISEGQHYADSNQFEIVEYKELQFAVKFDSTARYQTKKSGNQEDINKLYGFSDNNAAHHKFSARFGWNWARGSLRLYAYVYNNGIRSTDEIIAIQTNQEYKCSIKISGERYIFSVDDTKLPVPRASKGEKSKGYKLYPYFGGDEAAPHEIHIWIKEL